MSTPNLPQENLKLHRHHSFDNAWTGEDFAGIAEAFSELAEILKDHCGPYAAFAAIGTRNRVVDSADEHTKDGIHIVESLLSNRKASARYATRLTRFIGKTIDSRCHDGTTTAMLLFCMMASHFLSRVEKSSISGRYFTSKHLKAHFDEMKTVITSIKLDVDSIHRLCKNAGLSVTKAKVRKALAFHQAMVSSKSDVEMSRAIATVIENTPINTYGLYIRDTALHEKDERITVVNKPYQLTVKAGMGSMSAFNVKLGTEFYAKDCVVFATDEELIDGTVEVEYLNALLGIGPKDINKRGLYGLESGWHDHHDGRRLIIVAPYLSYEPLIRNIMVFNKANPKNPIVWFNTSPDEILREIFDRTLHAIAGKPTLSQLPPENWSDTLLHGVTVSYRKDVLGFEDLYPRDRNTLHPSYRNPKRDKYYTEFREELEAMMSFYSDHPADSPLTSDQMDFVLVMYRYLCCQRIFTVELGGTVHENKSMRTVFDDAMGSALSAVDNGVVLGGYGHLCHYLKSERDYISEATRNIYQKLLSFTFDKSTSEFTDPAEVNTCPTMMQVVNRDTDTVKVKDLRDNLMDFIEMNPVPLLFQPYVGFIEQFTRFADILPKLVSTTVLIDMGHIENGIE